MAVYLHALGHRKHFDLADRHQRASCSDFSMIERHRERDSTPTLIVPAALAGLMM